MKRALPLLLLLSLPALAAAQELDIRPLPLLSAPSLSFANDAEWQRAGSRPGDYIIGTTRTDGMAEEEAAAIAARPGASFRGDGGLAQTVNVEAYRGQRVRLTARLRSIEARYLVLFLRADRAGRIQEATGSRVAVAPRGQASVFYPDSPVSGTTGWQRYQIVADIPDNATSIAYGVTLAGGHGAAFADSFRLETVGHEVATTPSVPPRGWSGGWIGVPENWFGTVNGHVLPGARNETIITKAPPGK